MACAFFLGLIAGIVKNIEFLVKIVDSNNSPEKTLETKVRRAISKGCVMITPDDRFVSIEPNYIL